MQTDLSSQHYQQLSDQIKNWGDELGFQQVSITGIDLNLAGERLKSWLAQNYHGDMAWMAAHGEKRFRPEQLLAGTERVITVRMNYLPDNTDMIAVLKSDDKAYISRYALGRDYHKLMRKRLASLANKIEQAALEQILIDQTALDPTALEQKTLDQITKETITLRPFVDSAPVMEKALAERSGLGWIGKNTLLLNSEAGSWFFLGEIYLNLPLPVDTSTETNQCGKCQACLKVCPTDAFPAPYTLDARRCISYLTIEHKGTIPEEFREPIGNRVFGCDDCQIVCPWNREAKTTAESDFTPRHHLANTELATLFLWSEETFLKKTEGTPIRRIGYENWLRNLAVGLGNAPTIEPVISALEMRTNHPSKLVREHVDWALSQHQNPQKRRTPKLKKQSFS